MTTRSFGSEIRLELDIDAELDSALTLEGFNFVIKAGPAKFSGEGVVQGKRLSFSVNTGGQTLKRTLDLKAPPALKSVMGPQISRLDLTPGRTYQFPVFDPITQSEQTVASRSSARIPSPLSIRSFPSPTSGKRYQAWF